MSLEQAIEKNTAAILALTAAYAATAAGGRPAPAQPSDLVKATKAIEKLAAPVGAVTPPPAALTLTYDVVAKVVADFVKANGRAPAVILLEPFGVTTLVPLKDRPAELAGAYAAFTSPEKIAAAKVAAFAKAAA